MSDELISFKESSGHYLNLQLNIPNECPFCHQGILPEIACQTEYNEQLNLNVGILFKCPKCKKFFAREYSVINSFNHSISGKKTTPVLYNAVKKLKYDLPEEIEIISESFKQIYTQSLIAESDGLMLVSGIGFRKSIEFLIKDFLINYQNQNSEQIAKLPLAQAINKIENKKIQNLSKATTWLGNDETHYQRKYDDKDVNDMKRFIKALTFYISSEIVADEASDFINN